MVFFSILAWKCCVSFLSETTRLTLDGHLHCHGATSDVALLGTGVMNNLATSMSLSSSDAETY